VNFAVAICSTIVHNCGSPGYNMQLRISTAVPRSKHCST